MTRLLLLCLLALVAFQSDTSAQSTSTDEASAEEAPFLPDAMEWRCIGPFRGGRSTTVCGVVQEPMTYYFGSTGGGVWKTVDGGASWRNISDGQFNTGSVGAVAVAPSDPNVLYVGMGEAPIRGVMTSSGDGVYKSTDAGVTWQHIGLENSMHISQIRIHPTNPDVVFAAVQGNPYGPSEDRGVYRSTNGGKDWEKVHSVDENSGVSDLSMDMRNPRVLYAAYWDHTRLPWYMRSGGEGSGIWKSTDSGDSWTLLTNGLPDSIMGKIGVSVSGANSNVVYAIIESDQGGLYRSNDAGNSWTLMNTDRVLRARSWYYMHVFADPGDENTVHVLNAPYMRSTDGGKTFARIPTPHGDNHGLWINPESPEIMINANDGGANISYDNGMTWSTQRNQPTAQFYRVNADNQYPYRVYGGQQDNSSVSIKSRSYTAGIEWGDFHDVGGCESAYCAFDPDDPSLVYAGCIQGMITEYDVNLETSKDIMAYSDLNLGKNPKDMKYRFNWNAPIAVSMHDPSVIYHCAHVVLRSSDRGLNWTEVSPDLTRNISEHIDVGGGPITNEAAGGENYHTIMYFAESPFDANELWVGTDDGLIQLTRDGGETWSNITPPGMEEGIVNSIDLSVHSEGTAYVAFTRYKFGDFTPYVYITRDHGATWTEASNGIEDNCHVRVVREDHETADLLYAGTERGLFASWDGGANWQRFQLNLPIVPVTDLKVHQGDLIAATQGRAFWILDDLTPARQWADANREEFMAFPPRDAWIAAGPSVKGLKDRGQNPAYGITVFFNAVSPEDTITIEYADKDGNVIRTFATNAEDKQNLIKVKPGSNKHNWTLNRESLSSVPGLMTFGGTSGSQIGPGEYTVTVTNGDNSQKYDLKVHDHPESTIPQSAHDEKQALLTSLHRATQEVFDEVKNTRHIREQIAQFQQRPGVDQDTSLVQKGQHITSVLDSLEEVMVQAKHQTFQDVVNYSSRIDGELMNIQMVVSGSYPPITMGQKDKANDVLTQWEETKTYLRSFLDTELAEYNTLIRNREVPFISPVDPAVGKKTTRS